MLFMNTMIQAQGQIQDKLIFIYTIIIVSSELITGRFYIIMTDVFNADKRSEVMSRIRGKGNKSTEVKLLNLFRKNKISGWRRKSKLFGKPDFVFKNEKITVFVDGCFWHGCPKCYKPPKSNRQFWVNKISSNIKRDRKVSRTLRAQGWAVLRVWECSLKKRPNYDVVRIKTALERKRTD